jgi:hypothetical protein
MVSKARVENDPLQLDYTEARITLQLVPCDPPDPPHLSLSHQHRHPGHDGAEDIIISKGQDPPQGDLTCSTGS